MPHIIFESQEDFNTAVAAAVAQQTEAPRDEHEVRQEQENEDARLWTDLLGELSGHVSQRAREWNEEQKQDGSSYRLEAVRFGDSFRLAYLGQRGASTKSPHIYIVLTKQLGITARADGQRLGTAGWGYSQYAATEGTFEVRRNMSAGRPRFDAVDEKGKVVTGKALADAIFPELLDWIKQYEKEQKSR